MIWPLVARLTLGLLLLEPADALAFAVGVRRGA